MYNPVPPNVSVYFISGILAVIGIVMVLLPGYSQKSFGVLAVFGSGLMLVVGAVANALTNRLTVLDLIMVGVGAFIVLVIGFVRYQATQDSFNRSVQNHFGETE